MTKQELERQLADLRLKWKVYPKSYLEPNWWKFKCDSLKATQIKEQIKKIDSGLEILAADLTNEQSEEMFK